MTTLHDPALERIRALAEATQARMQTDIGMNTYVSNPMMNASAGVNAAPGMSLPGGSMSPTSGLLWLIGGLAVISVGTGYLARKGVRPEIGRFDAIDAVWNAATVGVVFAAFKLLAYRYHGHGISQAVLLLL